MKDIPYVVFDLETTGLKKEKDIIIEIAAAKFLNGKIIDEYETLINPQSPISELITKITGITDEMVENKPYEADALPNFQKFIGNDLLIAHNTQFDIGFTNHKFRTQLNYKMTNNTICTLKLARRMLNMPRNTLTHCCDYFGLVNEQAHRAMSDVKATGKVFQGMYSLLSDIGVNTLKEIIAFEQLPVKDAKIFYQKGLENNNSYK